MMSNRCREYQQIITDIAQHAWMLGDDERMIVMTMMARVQSDVMVKMADQYPEDGDSNE